MTDAEIDQIAELVRERNEIDEKIAKIISRPMTAGHLGEWLAARIFGIDLQPTAVTAAFDGRCGCSRYRRRPDLSGCSSSRVDLPLPGTYVEPRIFNE